MTKRITNKVNRQYQTATMIQSVVWISLIALGIMTANPRSASAQALVAAMLEPNVIQVLGLTEYQVQSLVGLYQQLEYFRAQGGSSCNPIYPSNCQQAFDTQRRQAERMADMEQQGIQRILTTEQMIILNQMLQG